MVPFFCLHYGMFTAVHGVFVFSFFWNFVHRCEYLRAGLQEQMLRPYGRVVVLHLAIACGQDCRRPESPSQGTRLVQERYPRMVSMLPPLFMQAANRSSANFWPEGAAAGEPGIVAPPLAFPPFAL